MGGKGAIVAPSKALGRRGILAVLPLAIAWLPGSGDPGPVRTPERRALAYLSREVPRWSRENRCFSCHNNGDAARALYAATRRPGLVDRGVLAETTRWLSDPGRWDRNGGDGAAGDRRLARLQFSAALADAGAAGAIEDRGPLIRAAARLARDQSPDGSWPIGDDGLIGSPATYGRPLATLAARDVLRAADPGRFRGAIDRADAWLIRLPIRNTAEAAAVLTALADAEPPGEDGLRRRCLDLFRRGQSESGGWGPFTRSPPEPFDTAVALLALARAGRDPDVRAMIRRGRAYLATAQLDDGSWPETTRPPGGESYAQRLSTAGWAGRALLATGEAD